MSEMYNFSLAFAMLSNVRCLASYKFNIFANKKLSG